MARTQAERHQYYLDNKAHVLAQTEAFRLRNTAFVQQMKASSPCTDCNRFFPAICMDYDHVRGTKHKAISVLVRTSSVENILKEIEKCELVCSNCHRIRTEERKNK